MKKSEIKRAWKEYKDKKNIMYSTESDAKRQLNVKCDDGWRIVFFGHLGHTVCLGCTRECPYHADMKKMAESRQNDYTLARQQLFKTIVAYVQDLRTDFKSQIAEYKNKKSLLMKCDDLYYDGWWNFDRMTHDQAVISKHVHRLSDGAIKIMEHTNDTTDAQNISFYVERVNTVQNSVNQLVTQLINSQEKQLYQFRDQRDKARKELDEYKNTMSVPAKFVAQCIYGR